MIRPTVGTRTDDVKPLEWTGTAWTAVCPVCDKAMTERDPQGYLACGDCGLRAVER